MVSLDAEVKRTNGGQRACDPCDCMKNARISPEPLLHTRQEDVGDNEAGGSEAGSKLSPWPDRHGDVAQ